MTNQAATFSQIKVYISKLLLLNCRDFVFWTVGGQKKHFEDISYKTNVFHLKKKTKKNTNKFTDQIK